MEVRPIRRWTASADQPFDITNRVEGRKAWTTERCCLDRGIQCPVFVRVVSHGSFFLGATGRNGPYTLAVQGTEGLRGRDDFYTRKVDQPDTSANDKLIVCGKLIQLVKAFSL